ncbi:hypothetical protein HBH53_265020 [Parastagonospora nodorum]|nr:hypothetical protein HBH53_265020 [Parastagonospora nodorum]KAH4767147.1 hypothetical protein HBH62_253360 [Parastagonospora nodorum]
MSQLQSAVEGSQQSTRHSWHSIRPILKVRPGPPASTWSVYEAAESLDSEKATAPLPIEAAQDSAPPAYDAQKSHKRPRHNESCTRRGLTPDSPLSKRVLLKNLKYSVSTIESATPSSQSACSTSWSNATAVVNVWQEGITMGINQLLPELLPKFLAPPSLAFSPRPARHRPGNHL